MGRAYPEWPAGYPKARLTQEYLAGRTSGQLDLSGRPGSRQAEWQSHPFLVIDDDEDGALIRVAQVLGKTDVSVFQDEVSDFPLVDAHRIESVEDLKSFVAAAGPTRYRVLMTAPKALLALREYLQLVVPVALELMLVGREKHMSRTLNTELGKFFDTVDVVPGVAKSRMLVGSDPKPADRLPAPTEFPQSSVRRSPTEELGDFTVLAHGATFGGTSVDAGSALLVQALADHRADLAERGKDRMLDLGCGNGWLLASATRLLDPREPVGVDISEFAVESTRATLAANGVAARVVQSDAGADLADGSFDLVLLNPPFHDGAKLTVDPARRMIESAHRLLKPGGTLVCVFNSVLRHRAVITRVFGQADQWARDRRFTVVTARR